MYVCVCVCVWEGGREGRERGTRMTVRKDLDEGEIHRFLF